MIEINVTPDMVRLLMKAVVKDSKYATTDHATQFIRLFKYEIEDALRAAVRDVVEKHYETK